MPKGGVAPENFDPFGRFIPPNIPGMLVFIRRNLLAAFRPPGSLPPIFKEFCTGLTMVSASIKTTPFIGGQESNNSGYQEVTASITTIAEVVSA